MKIDAFRKANTTAATPQTTATPPVNEKTPAATSAPENSPIATYPPEKTTNPINKGKPAPIRSFKLREAIDEEPSPKQDATPTPGSSPANKIAANEPFDSAGITQALKSFNPVGDSIALRSALLAYPPKINNQQITLEVDNELSLTKINELRPALRDHLITSLNNSSISLEISLHTESPGEEQQKKLYTAKDKFDHFASLNPVVTELKSLFGLEIE